MPSQTQALSPAPPLAQPVSSKREGRAVLVFNVLILLTFVVPFLIYFFHTFFSNTQIWRVFIFLVPVIGGLAGTHSFSTIYLLSDRDFSVGISWPSLKLYVMPLVIVLFNVVAVTVMSLEGLLWFMVLYVHYAMFHFGRQNLGVLAFSLMSSSQKFLVPQEKFLINGVTICGMCAALNLFMPAMMLDATLYPFELTALESVAPMLFSLGRILYGLVMIMALYYFWRNRERFTGYTIPIFWMCVFWYLPLYTFTEYPMLSLALFTTAHGLQYLVFLGFHSYFQSKGRWMGLTQRGQSQSEQRATVSYAMLPVILLPVLFLTLSMGAAWWLWTNQATLFSGISGAIETVVAHEGVFKMGMGLILGLTMAHYWVDQHIWKFKTPERRKWLLQRFPFLAL